ncbi:cyclin-like protein [Cristinia sonorae]|uniref:Cyclin-like protein n=1 Tax=Cristinia sonorae TaxID=1940300 RepID=A0A8K0XU54_9AGAR|nr:cyclin-like protein [Cristinia sonorae]
MATDFWASTHFKRWIVDRASLKQARAEDLQYVGDPLYLQFLAIFFANIIAKLCKKLQLRQRVAATATVFFRRFYLKNSYCETEPFIVIAACCYVAAKAEESPVHIKTVVTEARLLFGNEEYGLKSFPSDNSKLAEMEFYLVDDLECDLVVFHPYRSLMTLCGKEGSNSGAGIVAAELFGDSSSGERYWGTGMGKLELQETALQMAWFIINDTYRSDLCLLYPPHLIAVAAIYLTVVLHPGTRNTVITQTPSTNGPSSQTSQTPSSSSSQNPPAPTRRSSRSTPSTYKKPHSQDVIGFLAGLNVNMSVIATIAQEIISLYALWGRYKEDGTEATSARSSFRGSNPRSTSVLSSGTTSSTAGTPLPTDDTRGQNISAQPAIVTPAFLTQLLLRMREGKMAELAHPASGRPQPLDRRLERAQAAG